MQIRSTQLNIERLNGNRLFLHNFKNFSTSNVKTSLKIHIIHALFSTLLVLIMIYIITLVGVIFNIIDKKEGLASINDMNMKSAKIERQYNSSITALTKDYALQNGFVDSDTNHFAIRKDTAASFSFLYKDVNN